ncbi:hypothetical protein HMPREF1503_1843 [Olsenella uli MSTE5]|nr:hypothetical protein HMPREF1503_1843 [Olsenella uli MSTE5]
MVRWNGERVACARDVAVKRTTDGAERCAAVMCGHVREPAQRWDDFL